jgi:hypothetical protein
MDETELTRRRTWGVALIFAAAGCIFTSGLILSDEEPGAAIGAGILLSLGSAVCFIPIMGAILYAERGNWRFGVRALLITMTLFAVTLGWAAYLLRD